MMAERKGNEMKLTLKYLKKIYACEKAMDWFEENYGDETEITPEFVEHAENTDVYWIPWLMSESPLDIIKCLVESGADMRAQDDLIFRSHALYGHLDVVQYLIKNGADIHTRDDSTLVWNIEYGDLDMVKLLIKNGADIHAWDDRALKKSVYCGHPKVTEYLQSIIDKEAK